MPDLVLVRHGESRFNHEGRFSGWADVDLSKTGEDQALEVGNLLKAEGYSFDLVAASALKRTIRSAWFTLDALDQQWVPLVADWRLNERHYGALTGQNRADIEKIYGEAQVRQWRRGFDARPPEMDRAQAEVIWSDRRYANVPPERLPLTESLKDTVERVEQFYAEVIVPVLDRGGNVLVVAHGNSLRGMLKQLNHISDDDITGLEVANSTPIILTLDDRQNVTGQRELHISGPVSSFVF